MLHLMNTPLVLLLLLASRSLLFFLFSLLLGGFDLLRAAALWPLAVILTNGICITLLVQHMGGRRYLALFRLSVTYLKEERVRIILMVLSILLAAFIPNLVLTRLLFTDPLEPVRLLFGPLPTGLFILSCALFPVTQGLAELPFYGIYWTEKAEGRIPGRYLLAALILSGQHIFVPFVPDQAFILYRALMYLPFALLVIFLLKKDRRLLPVMSILHILLDGSAMMMYLMPV